MTVSETRTQNLSIVKQRLARHNQRPVAPFYKDILIGLLLVATPFLLFPRGYGLLAMLILPLLWLIRWVLVGRIIPRTPLDWPILTILLMVLVSLWATFDLSFSIGKVAGLLLGIVVFYAIVDLANTRSSLQTVIIFFILVGLGLAIISALGMHRRYKFPLIEPLVEQLPRALQGVRQAEAGFNANEVGGVLIFFIPLQLVLVGYWLRTALSWQPDPDEGTGSVAAFGHSIRRGKLSRALVAVCVGVSALITTGVLLLTQSRGALGGLVVGLVAIAALRTRWGKVLAVVGVIAVLALINTGQVDKLVTSGLETEAVGTIHLAGRLEMWSRALQGLADFPLGMGMNNFRLVMPVLYPKFLSPSTKDLGHAHNHLLQAGLDLGIPGLIAYLSLWLGAGFLLIHIVFKTSSPVYRIIALGLIGSLVAHFIYGITDAVALGAKPGFVFWWTLGLVAATYRRFLKDQSLS